MVEADDSTLSAAGASAEAVGLLRRAWSQQSGRVMQHCRRLGLRISALEAPEYPGALASIPDPPLVLFWKGTDPATLGPCLAVVGARRCTAYGERTARRLASEAAAAGIVVVSGLARGVDAAAHRGALEEGVTMAVLAGGLDHIYPGEHSGLAAKIVEGGGCLLSEQPPGMRPLAWLFPFRNRIITGLSAAVVVVEAGHRSGSLASARHALDQQREVFAVPGPIDSSLSAGANHLLSQGAPPFRSMPDLGGVPAFSKLLEEKSSKGSLRKRKVVDNLDPESARILAAIEAGRTTADEIQTATALDGTRVLTLLTALELDGLVLREALGRFRPTRQGR
ncbi:MAG: DNA-processing protein DprA [Candidatus Binatia bacterium]